MRCPFKKLSDAMLMGFVVKGKSVDALGPVETEGLVTAIRERLKAHLGSQLGAPPEHSVPVLALPRRASRGDLISVGSVRRRSICLWAVPSVAMA
jgi:hypothetical protein